MLRLVRPSSLLAALFLAAVSIASAQSTPQQNGKGSVDLAGKQWFIAYCAPCHGEDAKGHGRAAKPNEPPSDLTALASHNNGKFPADYVKKVLIQGVRVPAHGTNDMPVWGRTFTDVNARDLIRYLASVQASAAATGSAQQRK